MGRQLAAVALMVAALSGCYSSSTKHVELVKLTPAIIDEVGVPMYPGAKPAGLGAYRMVVERGPIRYRSLSLQLEAADPLDVVKAFYEARLPKGSLHLQFHFGPLYTTVFSYEVKRLTKGVVLTRAGEHTDILIDSSNIGGLESAAQKPE